MTMGKKIYVGNLSYSVDDAALEGLFRAHGKVQSASVVMDRNSGQSRGFGFVEMSNSAEALSAIAALNGSEHGGRALTVNEAKPREDRSSGGGNNRGWGSGWSGGSRY
jgi:RNA recognition motif-containing protein